MKKALLLIGFLILSNQLQAQWWKRVKGNGEMVTETRNTSDYETVSVSGSFDVVFVPGAEGAITLRGEENLLDHLSVSVKNKVLILKVKDNVNISTSWNKGIQITVPVEEIEGVKLSGSGDITSDFTLEASQFNVAISGSGDISLAIETNDLDSKISGSGDIDIRGRARNLSVKVSGSGDLNAYSLQAENANVMVSGSADVKVNVSGSLNARVAGSGDVYYRGNPKKVSSKVSGSGDVSKQ